MLYDIISLKTHSYLSAMSDKMLQISESKMKLYKHVSQNHHREGSFVILEPTKECLKIKGW